MGGSLRHWIVVAFTGAVLLLAFVGVVAYRTTTQLVTGNARVMRSHNLVEHLTDLRLLLDDAESGSRGYALTGRKEYLEPYLVAVAQVDAAVQRLRDDVAGDPDLLRLHDALPPLIAARLQVSRELIGARDRAGPDAAMQVIASGRGKRLRDAIWASLAAIQAKQEELLLASDRESQRSARLATWAVILASGLGVIVLVAATVMIARILAQRERAEAALRDSAAMQRAILDGTNHAIVSTDVQGRIRTVNATGSAWLGYSMSELAGQSLCILHDSEELRRRAEELTRALAVPVDPGFEALSIKPARGIAEERNWTYRRKNGSLLPVRVSMSALRDEAARVTAYVAIAGDLSERLAVERMKDEFVSVVSHELRTPLTSIRGSLRLLAGGVLRQAPERAGRMIQIAAENTERLMRLIDDILDWERIQAGQFTFNKSVCESGELMREAADSIRELAETAGVSVEVRPVHLPLEADAGRIVQSFTNLLGNAIKFSPAGAAVIFAADAGAGNVTFRVSDTGRGIPPDKIESIFERFQQVDASDSRDRGGTGLGLAITRSIVRQHGGDVWAESELGRGSTFFLRLPRAVRGESVARAKHA